MINKEPRLRTIVKINMRCAHAAILLLYGWACWYWTSPEWWGLGIMAILGFAGGTFQIIATVHLIAAIVSREQEIEGFHDQGSIIRPDRMAGERDLKDGGMIR